MSLALTRESFFWHKVHSLTGIVPVGFYMVQHLVLNSFSLAGRDQFNGVIAFFEGLPKHVLLATEIAVIWIPLFFHAIYGLFITGRSQPNYFAMKYRWSQNLMYTFQRASGILLFFFLIFHVATTTLAAKVTGSTVGIQYDAWHDKLTGYGYAFLILYMVGILCATYHLSYGIWNFCIRWGITIGEKAQIQVQKFSLVAFVALTLLGWGALAGFLIHGSSDAPAVGSASERGIQVFRHNSASCSAPALPTIAKHPSSSAQFFCSDAHRCA